VAEAVAAILFGGIVVYAVFGGADYGCGLWDLTAGGDERGGPVRAQIDRSLGPVWEANHVWLIFVLVYLWTGFPRAFAAVMTTLAVPWGLVGLGVIFRGGAFVFRKSSPTLAQARLHGLVFALSSVVTPFFLGAIAGAVASGRVPLEQGDAIRSWTGPLSIIGGVLAVLTCSFQAATLLAADADRAGDPVLAAAFGRRARWSGAVTGAVALAAALTIESSAPQLAGGLRGRAAPVVVLSALFGSAALLDLRAGRWARARLGTSAAVAAVVVGWGVAQYPAVLVGSADIRDVAGNRETLGALVVVFGLFVVFVVPSLVWLLRLVERPAAGPPAEREAARRERRAPRGGTPA
jgi:cytochrome d ubiquinol oxidase subunit II